RLRANASISKHNTQNADVYYHVMSERQSVKKQRPVDLTRLLIAWSNGDARALEALAEGVYKELHRIARHYMQGEQPGHTLQTTALINEAFLRIIDWKNVEWQNRAHFFSVAAQMMRRVLVDHA